MSEFKIIKWPKHRTSLPENMNYLMHHDIEVNKIIADGLKNHITTLDIADQVIELLHTQRLQLMRVVQ